MSCLLINNRIWMKTNETIFVRPKSFKSNFLICLLRSAALFARTDRSLIGYRTFQFQLLICNLKNVKDLQPKRSRLTARFTKFSYKIVLKFSLNFGYLLWMNIKIAAEGSFQVYRVSTRDSLGIPFRYPLWISNGYYPFGYPSLEESLRNSSLMQ